MKEEENKQRSHYTMSLDHRTKCPLNNKNIKASVLSLLESSLLGNVLFLQPETNISGVLNSCLDHYWIYLHTLCISSSPASTFWEKGKKRVEQATQLKTSSLRKPETGDCWCLSSPFLKENYLECFHILVQ